MNITNAVNVEDIHKLAKRRLPKFAFDFIEGGVEDEIGLDRNRAAFDKYALLPRYLVHVEKVDQSVELFGRTYASPFGISPTGIAALFRPGADLMLAEAAKEANIPFIQSGAASASVEQVAKVAPDNAWFQLYGARDFKYSEDLIKRADAAGISTLVLTVDVPVTPRRERNIRNGFRRPLKMSPWLVLDAMSHPAWTIDYLRTGGLPRLELWAKYAREGASADEVADVLGSQTPTANQTWETLEKMRKLWPRTFLIKGIMHPDDAVRAMNAGIDGLIVSNHGARQLDRAPAPLEMIPTIRRVTADRLPLILDGGVRRGAEILIAMCLGVKSVVFGRPTLYGAAAAGRVGVDKVIDIVRREVEVNMKQIGCPRLADLGPDFLWTGPADGTNLPAT